MNARQIAALLFLSAVWGASFLFIRVAAPVMGPFPLMAGRVLIAAGVLWVYARLRRTPVVLRPWWPQLLALGLVNAAAPFVLIAQAELELTASLAAILLAVQPLITTLIDSTSVGERISPRRLAGLLLGVAGVAVLMGWSPVAIDRAFLLSVAAMVAGAFCYAIGAIYAKRRLSRIPVPTLALGQQLGAAAWLAVPALWTLPKASATGPAIASLLALALLSTALAYVVFFRLLGEIGPVKTSTITYIIPVFGVLWGAVFLAEPLTAGMLAGLGCILASLLLVNNVPFGGRAAAAHPAAPVLPAAKASSRCPA